MIGGMDKDRWLSCIMVRKFLFLFERRGCGEHFNTVFVINSTWIEYEKKNVTDWPEKERSFLCLVLNKYFQLAEERGHKLRLKHK